ncbi:ImmA/IrrE family metallo-endopeptidase [Tissierella praeacuta]|uniref:ImmA/IrrE family metallo-endopeptidase n=1 Tax=Tissierella praeacuta TaxID=43131 RepID=UPI0028B119C5|nr:ImmA/IrrE family metallo-endopeptidase [Tissierella praeacuta]
MCQDIIEIKDGLLELYNTRNPFELCRCLDIKIIETNLGNNILGFFQRIMEEEIIYLNNNIDNYNEKKYVCFHELGHVVCHPELSICFLEKTLYITDRYENQADIFAAYFLIPDDDEIDICEIENMTTKQLSSYFKVPEKLIELRFGQVIDL